jgi:hypothetical protein
VTATSTLDARSESTDQLTPLRPLTRSRSETSPGRTLASTSAEKTVQVGRALSEAHGQAAPKKRALVRFNQHAAESMSQDVLLNPVAAAGEAIVLLQPAFSAKYQSATDTQQDVSKPGFAMPKTLRRERVVQFTDRAMSLHYWTIKELMEECSKVMRRDEDYIDPDKLVPPDPPAKENPKENRAAVDRTPGRSPEGPTPNRSPAATPEPQRSDANGSMPAMHRPAQRSSARGSVSGARPRLPPPVPTRRQPARRRMLDGGLAAARRRQEPFHLCSGRRAQPPLARPSAAGRCTRASPPSGRPSWAKRGRRFSLARSAARGLRLGSTA